jgi:hypothetical protein
MHGCRHSARITLYKIPSNRPEYSRPCFAINVLLFNQLHLALHCCTSVPQGVDLYLINWCSVQRIARRCRILPDSRIDRLDGLGFDWTGADPLS